VVVPGGVRYRVLALPEVEAMSTKMLRTVRRLQREGAKVAWKKAPTRAPGLGEGAEGDAEVRRLAAEIFAEGAIRGSAGEALKTLGVEPQIAVVGKLPKNVARLNWIHRCEQGADWYFVAMPNREPAEVELSFRSVAKRLEIWDAENGKMGPAAIWREEAGRTVVRVPFGVCGSKFVVFRDSATMSPSTGLGKPSTGLGHFVSAEVRARAFPAVASGKKGELRFLKATYGADTRQKDLTEKLNRLAEAGYVDDVVGNQLAGGDPASMTVKQLEATYVYRGVTNSITLREHQQLIVPPSHGHELKMLPLEAWEDGRFWAWQPLEAVLKAEDGTQRKLRAEMPAPMVVEGAWQVEFPHGFLPNLLAKGAAEKVEFGELVSWTEREEKDINYFSGTAVYRKQVKLPELAKGTRVVLDLGRVKEVAEVTVNGKRYESLWRPPYSVEITDVIGGATLEIEIRVANLWVNRLIGDDREFAPDCEWVERRTSRGAIEYGIKELPEWVKTGKTSPTGRHTFTTWRHWGKEDELMESGLMGPVKIRFAVEAK